MALLVVFAAALGLLAGFLLLRSGGEDGGLPAAPTAIASDAPVATARARPTEPVSPTASPAAATPTPRPTLPPVPSLGPPSTFVCQETQSVSGPVGSKWKLSRVHFRTGRGYDRVIYELTRTGTTDDPITPVASARESIPGEGMFIGAPDVHAKADTRLDVLLVNGVRDATRLSGYQPRGMRIVKSLSTQPYRSHVNYADPADDPYTADVGTYSPVDVQGQGCLALRVLGWDGVGDDTAWVYLDVELP